MCITRNNTLCKELETNQVLVQDCLRNQSGKEVYQPRALRIVSNKYVTVL